MTAEVLDEKEAPSSTFEIEPTFVAPDPSYLCMLPDWVLLLFSIPTETQILDEPAADVSSQREIDSPMTTKSTDSLELKASSQTHQDAVTVPIQSTSSKNHLHLAGSSVTLVTQSGSQKLSPSPKPVCQSGISSSFHLRIGPDYNTKRRKAPSGEAFMDLVGMDFIRTPQGRLDDIGKHVDIPPEWMSLNVSSSANPRIPPIFIVNVQGAELYKHTMFGYPMDVPGTAFVFYFKMKQETMDAMANLSTAPPALRLFADYVANGPEAYAEMMRRRAADNNPTGVYDNKYFGKFKICLRCDNIKEPCMSWIPSVAVPYNEKPTVITYSGTLLRGPGYVEMDVDTRQFGILAGHTIPMLMKNLHHAVNSVAFCIESVEESEMPERAFGVATMSKFKCSSAMPSINVAPKKGKK